MSPSSNELCVCVCVCVQCLPPQVLLDGECLNYLTMSTEQQAEARKALRKNAYYRYRSLDRHYCVSL